MAKKVIKEINRPGKDNLYGLKRLGTDSTFIDGTGASGFQTTQPAPDDTLFDVTGFRLLKTITVKASGGTLYKKIEVFRYSSNGKKKTGNNKVLWFINAGTWTSSSSKPSDYDAATLKNISEIYIDADSVALSEVNSGACSIVLKSKSSNNMDYYHGNDSVIFS